MKKVLIVCLSLVAVSSFAQNLPVTFKSTKTTVDVEIGGKAFTSYYFQGERVLKKAVLFPLISAK